MIIYLRVHVESSRFGAKFGTNNPRMYHCAENNKKTIPSLTKWLHVNCVLNGWSLSQEKLKAINAVWLTLPEKKRFVEACSSSKIQPRIIVLKTWCNFCKYQHRHFKMSERLAYFIGQGRLLLWEKCTSVQSNYKLSKPDNIMWTVTVLKKATYLLGTNRHGSVGYSRPLNCLRHFWRIWFNVNRPMRNGSCLLALVKRHFASSF